MKIKIDTQTDNPLIQSYLNNDLYKFNQLIKDGANINCVNQIGNSLISMVIVGDESEDNKKYFDILMENNVCLDPIGQSTNLLYLSLLFGNKFFFEKLLDGGISINAVNKNSESYYLHHPVIFEIARRGEYGFFDLILNKKLTPGITDRNNDTILTHFIKYSVRNFTKDQSIDILRRLIEMGEDINERGHNGCMAIHNVVGIESKHILDILLEEKYNIDIDSRDMWGNTALILASFRNDFESVEKLIKRRANMNIINGKNESAFFLSIVCRCEKSFDILLDNNAAVVDIDKDGNNILHKLISYEWTYFSINIKIYEKIINKHPELLFAKNNDGKTPLDLLTRDNLVHSKKTQINKIANKIDRSNEDRQDRS